QSSPKAGDFYCKGLMFGQTPFPPAGQSVTFQQVYSQDGACYTPNGLWQGDVWISGTSTAYRCTDNPSGVIDGTLVLTRWSDGVTVSLGFQIKLHPRTTNQVGGQPARGTGTITVDSGQSGSVQTQAEYSWDQPQGMADRCRGDTINAMGLWDVTFSGTAPSA